MCYATTAEISFLLKTCAKRNIHKEATLISKGALPYTPEAHKGCFSPTHKCFPLAFPLGSIFRGLILAHWSPLKFATDSTSSKIKEYSCLFSALLQYQRDGLSMATQRALFLKVKALEMLRNTIGGGSPRQELAGTLCTTKGTEDCVQPGDPILRDSRSQKLSRKSPDFQAHRLRGCKSPRIPLFNAPPPEAPVQAVILLLHHDYFNNPDIWDSAVGKPGLSW